MEHSNGNLAVLTHSLWTQLLRVVKLGRMETTKQALKRLALRTRELRLAKGWTQEACALEAAMSSVYLSGIERGVRNPTVKNLARLATALDVDIAELFRPLE